MYTSFTKASTRTLMIEKAIALFKENGTEHVSVKDICDEARVSRNAFYYHFESKDLLFDAIGDYVSMVSKKRIDTLYGCKSYFQQFWEFYKAYLLTVIEMGSDIMNHICISRTMKGRADYFSYIDDELSAKMIKLAELAQAEGQTTNPCPPDDLLWVSYSLIRGVNIKWCFQWGTCDLITESLTSLNTLFIPTDEFKLDPSNP